MKKPRFSEDAIYHIYNRGVEKRKVFLDKEDHFRFIHDLFEMNDEAPTANVLYYFNPRTMEAQPSYIQKERRKRKLLVEILIFTLMPNHFHLLVRQKKPGGIVQFMQKLGTGYSMYFNRKYKRVGGLFQGRFKAVLIDEQAHFLHLPFYIHTNPLQLKYGGSTSIYWRKALKFLENYKWSSFPDYIGKQNLPSITARKYFLNFFGGEKQYLKETIRLLKETNNEKQLDLIREVALE